MSHFAIAGGGIAGLATALALGRDGHRTDVYERREILGEVGAGLQLSPNATRIARALGILEHLQDHAVEPLALRIRRGKGGADIARLPLGAAARGRYGSPFLVLHRADLQRILAAAALACPTVSIHLSTSVEEFDTQSGAIRLAGGRTVGTAVDGLVRADGLHTRRMGKNLGVPPVRSGKVAWRALVPAEALPRTFIIPETNLWLGGRAHVVHYPLRGGSIVNIVVIIDEDRSSATAPADIWAEAGDPAVLSERLRGWHPDVIRLLDSAVAWRRWPLFDGPSGGPWSQGRETAVGDAAHPMLPFLAQGASQAFEDAGALAKAVARFPEDAPAGFSLYESSRAPAAERVQAASRRQGRIYHLEGRTARARDFAMRLLGPERMLARMDWLYGLSNASSQRDLP